MSEFFSWRRSSRTQGQGQCVEVGFAENAVGIRDSKNPLAGLLTVERAQWRAFLERIRKGNTQR
ncbi:MULTISPECIES: DUF397 domain-containing protein [unclassified Actinopolyspora]|uniref:DUF397 domain-containing protein n=1 Tax=unclassified Actinopolyspora TaxID=2639451 RepID=UPI0013F64654|nr:MULTISPECIES: DUF397 domain-containing protein [unclassified Actinopolyspora]NHD18081.1 DUF397 domain-containing protein [Actinopolyspora sp. BKK2]NHE78596.1 DUF397 domain-containing protein [Actinopolyspora sp. BKK1]